MAVTQAPEQTIREAAVPSRRPPLRSARGLFLVCELLVLACAARRLWMHAAAIRLHLGLPFQVDYEEGNILNALVRITHGLTPYPDPHAIPNILNPYGPLAYYLLAAPVRIFGVALEWPRALIVACMVAVCCLVGLMVARRTGSALTGIVFGAIYGTLPVVQSWSAILRVDFLALALSAAGLYVFTQAVREDQRPGKLDAMDTEDKKGKGHSSASSATNPRFLFSAVLFVAALLVKYTYVAAPAACVLYLVAQRRWKLAARWTVVAAAMFTALLLFWTAATRGTIFTHLFRTHADPFSWKVYLFGLSAMVATSRVLAVLAAVCLANELLRRKLSIATLWLLLASITSLTAGKLGSNSNHFLEWPAALCLCAGAGWSELARLRPRVLAAVAGVAATAWLGLWLWRVPPLPFDAYGSVQECQQAYAFVRDYPSDRVLSDNVGALVLSGKTVWISNPFVYSQMVMRGGWADAGLESMVRSGGFDLIVGQWNYPGYPNFLSDGAERYSPGVIKAMAENYHVTRTYKCTDARVMLVKK